MTPRTLLLSIALACVPAAAGATAGFAETHSDLHYNHSANLHWIHPGDGCDSWRYCFSLEKNDARSHFFRDLYLSLRKINVPEDEGPLILAQASSDETWLVYDLDAEQYLVRSVPYETALRAWVASGRKPPRFADAEKGARGLSRTWRSRWEGLSVLFLLFSPLIVFLALPVLSALSWILLNGFRATKQKGYLWWGLLCLLPSLCLWLIVLRFAFSLIKWKVG
ncbi:MAG TPA: hypothetical protein VK780_06750 [Thermoanaerobaculia bacterium]|nr:hypothetical protein [Thermoanaerobaculia bacterium]